jgi:hypothetical protein
MYDLLKTLIKQFMPYAQEKIGFKSPPRLFLRQDNKNAANPLGKTAFYDPQAKSVTIYTTNRHPKDVMRSLSHELVHHKQNCDGQFDHVGEMGEGYAQNDTHLRGMERQAYELGNMCFRDWEDSIKGTIYNEHLLKGVNTMSTKTWKNKELTTLLSEAWGFGFNLKRLNEDDEGNKPPWLKKDGEEEEDGEKLEEMCPDAPPDGGEDMAGAHRGMGAEEEGEPEDPSAIVDELGELLARLQAALGGGEEVENGEPMEIRLSEEEEEEELEERRGRGRKGPHIRGPEDSRLREEKIRQLIRKSLKNIIEKKQTKKRTKK